MLPTALEVGTASVANSILNKSEHIVAENIVAIQLTNSSFPILIDVLCSP